MTRDAFDALLEERRQQLREELRPVLAQASELVCEIGCGHGHFLTAYAAAHRHHVCVGLDLLGERIARARRKRDRAGLSNLHFLQADARLFLEVLPEVVRISSAFVLFPDPWPKLRHHKHRIVQAGFLDALAVRASPDCRLLFRTDHEPYYLEAKATIRRHPQWQLVDEAWPFDYETVFQQRAAAFASLAAVWCEPCEKR
jgi:tRNA (guanine-N7-)-methyltransferase